MKEAKEAKRVALVMPLMVATRKMREGNVPFSA